MYQDINIKNPIFLSSFIFIILSLLLIYRKQNYFAKVQISELHICQKSAIKALFHSIFILNSSKKCHNGTFLFFSEKLIHFKLILDYEPKTCVFGTSLPINHRFVPKQADFGTYFAFLPWKVPARQHLARRIVRTACAAHAAMHSIISFRTLFNCFVKVKILPLKWSLKNRPFCKHFFKTFTKLSQTGCFLVYSASWTRGRKNSKC